MLNRTVAAQTRYWLSQCADDSSTGQMACDPEAMIALAKQILWATRMALGDIDVDSTKITVLETAERVLEALLDGDVR